MTKLARSEKGGFTLLEVLLVVGIISILAGIIILAINPTKQLGDTRNAQRRSDVLTILNALYQYSLDNNGAFPDAIVNSTVDSCDSGTTANEICQDDGTCTGIMDLYTDLVGASSTYLVSMPIDPSTAASAGLGSGYFASLMSNGRVTVCAPDAENTATISVTR